MRQDPGRRHPAAACRVVQGRSPAAVGDAIQQRLRQRRGRRTRCRQLGPSSGHPAPPSACSQSCSVSSPANTVSRRPRAATRTAGSSCPVCATTSSVNRVILLWPSKSDAVSQPCRSTRVALEARAPCGLPRKGDGVRDRSCWHKHLWHAFGDSSLMIRATGRAAT